MVLLVRRQQAHSGGLCFGQGVGRFLRASLPIGGSVASDCLRTKGCYRKSRSGWLMGICMARSIVQHRDNPMFTFKSEFLELAKRTKQPLARPQRNHTSSALQTSEHQECCGIDQRRLSGSCSAAA
jgi:hypothetical protein